jgi:protein SCO1/2
MSITTSPRLGVFVLVAVIGLTANIAPAQTVGQPAKAKEAPVKEVGKLTSAAIPDVEVLDQNGDKKLFYTDLIKGKTVIVNFLFTSCKYVCPMQGKSYAKIQEEFGARIGQDVFLVSVSMDPETDTPERLKEWSKQFNAKPGWSLVTGSAENIDKILTAMTGDGAATETKHSPFMFVGNDDTDRWLRVYGLSEPAKIRQMVNLSKQYAGNGEQ